MSKARTREILISLQGSDIRLGGQGAQEGPSLVDPRPNARVLSIDRVKDTPKETLECLLSSALRSEDAELDQILSAIEEISNSVKSGAASECNLDSALQRAASCAVRQSLLDREVRSLAITDELTGLYNRRGFLASATHQLKLAQRNAQDVLLFFCDVDNLKGINDSCGHREGDLAIIRAADALEETFRDSDILARLGGDEFAVLASVASVPNGQAIMPRIEKNLEKANAEESRYRLSFSIGIARFHSETPSSLGELMARADQDMYLHKKYDSRPASLRHS
jgi:diguanylate cyclase (GGDEF)-like protein